ncbi:MAG: tripartite tricarboxylate transporter TctB family protein [Pseudomonadota bacterium]
MALDRWIALVILGVACAYGYAAFFTMDQLLPPFMQRNPVWPSTFPKVIAVLTTVTALIVVLGLEKPENSRDDDGSQSLVRTLGGYDLKSAGLLLGLMVLYALALRPAGFLLSTVGFITLGGIVLGERRVQYLIPIAAVAAGVVWYLVEGVLGIFLRPLPFFLG